MRNREKAFNLNAIQVFYQRIMDEQKILYFCIAFFLSISLSAFAEMYLWTDDQGTKHYSNQKPPETIDKFKTEPEIKPKHGVEKSSNEDDAELERQILIRKQKDELEKSNWMKEKKQKEAMQLEKEKKRRQAKENAKSRVQTLEKRLEYHEDRQRKYGRNTHEKTIRNIREELFEAKEELRNMELHGDFSAVE